MDKNILLLKRIQTVIMAMTSILICIYCVMGIVSLIPTIKDMMTKPVPEETEVVEEVEEETEEAHPILIEGPLTREAIMFAEFEQLSQIEDKKDWYLCYLGFVEDYPEYDRGSTLYDRYTEDEIYLMQRVIETEVYGKDFEAKANVASVILNRIEGDNGFPNDATKVCTAPGQFVYSRKQISEDTKLALEYAAEIEDTTNGALYFNSMAPMDSWNGRTRIFTDHVGHSFY